ncbi:MAG TPA: hypothetical protein VL123_09290 [Candidatus Udaeobacter sp.]|jgi:hypothetical protein|nr:hypothetical protein [Candidatus Udaeobacter sp.]
MLRRIAPGLALLIVVGCAGPAKLAQKSEEKLANGENGRAWDLAIRALDKDPGNTRARAAASAAGNAMARNWEQRIHGLAQTDTMAAAEQVLDLAAFRTNAARYAVITPSPESVAEERAVRLAAARTNYVHGISDLQTKRPRRAWMAFEDAQRFVPDYRDASRLSDKAFERAQVRVAMVPFFTASGDVTLGRDVASSWRDALARNLESPATHFTHVLGGASVEQQMTVSQLSHLTRSDAIALGRKAGAERVVWGSVGNVDGSTRFRMFTDVIARRIVERNAKGEENSWWVDVPVEVISRERTVTADVDYEIIATREGATLAHQTQRRSTSARVVWTSFSPEGDLGSYALVSDLVRAARPDRAREVESKWKEVCGENTTLQQVLEARRSNRSAGHYDRDALPRFMAGAAFVFLQDLPPQNDLAYAALAQGWQPLAKDLMRLDAIDDVDLAMPVARGDER